MKGSYEYFLMYLNFDIVKLTVFIRLGTLLLLLLWRGELQARVGTYSTLGAC